jgi:hypothetical protein
MANIEAHDGAVCFGPPVLELREGELLVLWAMRRWAIARQAGEDVGAALAPPFAVAGMRDGPSLVDEFMTLLAVAARRRVTLRCITCRVVSRDENLLVGVLRSLQGGRPCVARADLSDVVPHAATAAICESGERLAVHLARLGLSLERRRHLRLIG